MDYYVTMDEDRSITIKYNKIEPWQYNVEYYALYQSVNHYGCSIDVDFVDSAVYFIDSEIHSAYNHYETVNCKQLSSYEKYQFVKPLLYLDEDIPNDSLIIHPDGGTEENKAIVKFYLAPNQDDIDISLDDYFVCGGNSHFTSGEPVKDSRYSFIAPDTIGGIDTYYYYYRHYSLTADSDIASNTKAIEILESEIFG